MTGHNEEGQSVHKVCLALTVVINLFNRVKEQSIQVFSYEKKEVESLADHPFWPEEFRI